MKQPALLLSLIIVGLSLLILLFCLSSLSRFSETHHMTPHALPLPGIGTQTTAPPETQPTITLKTFSLTLSVPWCPGLSTGVVLINRVEKHMASSDTYLYEPAAIDRLSVLLQSLELTEITSEPNLEVSYLPPQEGYTVTFPNEDSHLSVLISEDGTLLYLPQSSRLLRIVNTDQGQAFYEAVKEAHENGYTTLAPLGGLTDNAPFVQGPFHIGILWEIDDKHVAELFTVSNLIAYWENQTKAKVTLPHALVTYLYEDLCQFLYYYVDGIYLPTVNQEGLPTFSGMYYEVRKDGVLNYDEGFFAHLFLMLLRAFSSPDPVWFALFIAGLAVAGLLFDWLDRKGGIWSAWLVHASANLAINLIGMRMFGIL